MQAQNGTIWVVWASKRTGNFEIFYKTYDGSAWSSETQLTEDPGVNNWDPAVMQAQDGTIWVVWVKNEDLYYSVYDGISWSTETPLTTDGATNSDRHPSITQLTDGTIWVVWDSDRKLQEDIYYKVYDGTWSPDMQLTIDLSDDSTPSILQAMDGTLWIVWYSTRLDNMDIYYRTGLVPNPHDVAIFSVTPSTAIAIQGETVSIEVVTKNQGTEGEYVTVYCYTNSTLIGNATKHVAAGQLWTETFQWNTSSFTPGVYVIGANASVVPGETNTADNTYVDGIVTIKGIHDVAVINVVPSVSEAYPTWTIQVNATVMNQGTAPASFNVTAYYNASTRYEIGTQNVTSLVASENTTLTFSWSLSGVASGLYTISAEAILLGDSLPTNNHLPDGTVKVRILGDVDGNDSLDIMDMLRLKMIITLGKTAEEEPFADVDGNDSLDIMDMLRLKIIITLAG